MGSLEDYFREELPRRLANRPRAQAGTIAFVVQSTGSWVLDLAAPVDRCVRPATGHDADLTLVFAAPTFADVVKGLPPKVGRGLSIFGDLRLFGQLSPLW